MSPEAKAHREAPRSGDGAPADAPADPAAPDGDGGARRTAGSEHLRVPQQQRSRRTLERIVDAALEIIEEEGVAAATVQRVVDRAGSSVGSFYARFEGKADLLLHLEQRLWTEAARRWREAVGSGGWEDLELAGVVESVVRALVRIQEEDAEIRRSLGRSGAPGAGEEARRLQMEMEDDAVRLLLLHRKEISHPEPELACLVAFRWAVGGIRGLLPEPARRSARERAPGDAAEEFSASLVVREMARGLTSYLSGPSGGDGDEGDVEFFDVWQ